MTKTMRLFKLTSSGDVVLVDEKKFRYRSEAQARLVADDYAETHGYYEGEGFVVICEDNKVLHTFNLLAKEHKK